MTTMAKLDAILDKEPLMVQQPAPQTAGVEEDRACNCMMQMCEAVVNVCVTLAVLDCILSR